jgi:hypothetical protein
MRRANLLVRLSLGLLLTIACGGAGDDDPAAADAGARTDASADGGGSACPRLPAAPDRVRPMIVSKPYNPDSSPANAYQVLAVGLDGTITDSGQRFEMRRAIYGEFTFTPDGKVGLLAQNDGTIGVVGFDGMIPTVIHAAFTGDFYASRVALDATGEYAYIVDANFRNNGGGLFRSAIGCDGSLGAPERLVDSKLAEFMFVEDGGTALVVARDVADSAVGHDVHRVTLTGTPAVSSGTDAFGHDEAIVSAAVRSPDGQRLWVGDNNQFIANPNQVVIVSTTGALTTVGAVEINDPAAIRVSPFADVAVVASGFGNALFVVDRGGAGGAYRVAGQVTYSGGRPALPSAMASVDVGALRGHVWVAENVSIRHLQFTSAGGVTDLGSFTLAGEVDAIPGAIGVAP